MGRLSRGFPEEFHRRSLLAGGFAGGFLLAFPSSPCAPVNEARAATGQHGWQGLRPNAFNPASIIPAKQFWSCPRLKWGRAYTRRYR